MIEVGQKILSKKDVTHGSISICTSGKIYVIDGVEHRFSSDYNNIKFICNDGTSMLTNDDPDSGSYIWDYFIDLERVKRLAKEHIG